jgi:hypothetical protein
MFAFRAAKSLTKKSVKPTLFLATALSLLWVGIDLCDGASERFHHRVEQAQTEVSKPVTDMTEQVADVMVKFWHSIESNPGPSILAAILFVLTIVYHKIKGRSTVAAVKAAVLREPPIEQPLPNPTLERIQRDVIENQMLETYDKLEKRQKDLPSEIENAAARVRQADSQRVRTAETADRAANEFEKAKAYHQRLLKEREDGSNLMAEIERELNTRETAT